MSGDVITCFKTRHMTRPFQNKKTLSVTRGSD